jgi:hypothetical protein
MRNLELRIAAGQSTGLRGLVAWAKDTDSGHVYGLTDSGQIYRILQADGPQLIAE